jgi:cell wall-associated NlpC family hydrolase
MDDRVHAYRRDIADIALAGRVIAPHYARPLSRGCGIRPTFMRYKPKDDGILGSELLPGEEFAVLEIAGGWAWGYSRHDHYVGYVEAIELVDPVAPTHVVPSLRAPIYPEPSVNVPALASLPMGSRVHGEERSGFLLTEYGYLPFTDLREIGAFEEDPVGVAQRLVGAPYLLGGRTATGIDCSGLVQLSLALCGIRSPRDSDQQRVLGTELPGDATLRRGDLIFFEGHVGFMVDAEHLIHATAHAGATVIEPLAAVHSRNPVQEMRRL